MLKIPELMKEVVSISAAAKKKNDSLDPLEKPKKYDGSRGPHTIKLWINSVESYGVAFAKWLNPSERKQFEQTFAESKVFENYSSKPEPKQRLIEQLYIEHFQFWKQATKHKSSIIQFFKKSGKSSTSM